MKRTDQSEPFLSWCLIVRNCATTIEATLKSLRERTPQAEIVVVDTCSSDTTPNLAQRYADVFEVYKGPRGNWNTEMLAFDDASAARQHSFELAHGRWRGWIDADDVLAGPAEAERLLKLNNRWKTAQPGAKIEGAEAPCESLEDLLRKLEATHPNATCVWAPYLYQRNADDTAVTWQDRERIVRWKDPPQFKWSEEAHEILVPINGHVPLRVDFAHLLFVHEKKFTGKDYDYSLRRHYAILLAKYEAGDRTNRRCLYLANQAKFLDPKREREFLDAAQETAYTTLDRYRTAMALGQYWAERKLYHDAMAAFGGAFVLHDELPDAWLAAGEVALSFQDYARAVEYLGRGCSANPLSPASFVNPRHHALRYPTLLARALVEFAKQQVKAGLHEQAVGTFQRAADEAKKVWEHPSVGDDRLEAQLRFAEIDNLRRAQQQALALRGLFEYLRSNDESERAGQVHLVAPHNLHEHPLVRLCAQESLDVEEHLNDAKVYTKNYNDVIAMGAIRSRPEWFEPTAAPSARPTWVASWIKQFKPGASILEIGCHDGIIGIPIMRQLPDAKYHGVDINNEAIEWCKENIEKYNLHDRMTCSVIDSTTLRARKVARTFDVVLWCEVIEHVSNPYTELRAIKDLLADDGLLFITTPWGSFDHGAPPAKTEYGTPRGHIGHVRVVTPRELEDYLRCVRNFALLDLYRADCESAPQYTLHAVARKVSNVKKPHVACVVPGALWPWNGRSIHAEGMGASEETIAYLAERLHQKNYCMEVYGPTEREDTCLGVQYWPREQLRYLADSNAKLLVSRSPGSADVLDNAIGKKLPKILWLQDAVYPDLNLEVAEKYERIVVVSEWHKRTMHELHGVPLDKMVVRYNFILPEHFLPRPPRRPHHFIYASSPDRGLNHLLKLWPKIRAKWDDATLSIFYGWRGCSVLGSGRDPAWTQRFTEMRKSYEELRFQPGVAEHEMVNHLRIAQEFMLASVWLYPTDFAETCCTNAIKARAAGCIPVTTHLAALDETAACSQGRLLPVSATDDEWLQAVAEVIDTSEDERGKMALEAIETYNLDSMLPAWGALLG